MRNQTSDSRRSGRPSRPFRKKKRKGGGGANGNKGGQSNGSRVAQGLQPQPQMAAVCQKCGQPASDGKLCSFHRNLLNALRNGGQAPTGKQGGGRNNNNRGPSTGYASSGHGYGPPF